MACEFIASCAANAVGNITTEYASPYVSYFFQFGKIVEEFKNRRKELELKSDQVKNDVNNAVNQTEVIEKAVRDWLIRAEKELVETQTLEAEIERNKCFNWCPRWGWRYCLSRKVAKRTISINKLLESCNFSRVGHRRPPEGIEFFPSKDFMPNESSNFTFNEIIKALNTDGVNMIGLYGMPGVGKTTLAKEVGRHAKEQKLFDKVVMASMSQTPNINKIQDKIAELLGLKFEVSTDEGKAEELWRRLQGVEKILVIIDDVWNEFKLHTVGIPFGVEHRGCKILLTTRLRQVCVRMNCQQKFQLDILSKDEAWALIKDTAGLEDVSSRLNDVAKEVARECKGLPLAIVTIGKALKGASLDGWKAANKRLKDSRHLDNEEVSQGIYNCLKLSYDYLKGDNIRTCFLLCSLFPEDWDIEIEELVMFAIGHGLFSHIYLIEDLRREIREALRNLQESGLLLRTDDDDDDERYVSMHDVVRDFAHWITSTGKNIFMVKEGLMEWPPSESCGSHTAISFWNSNINIFHEKLDFPELKILIFTGKPLVKVPITFVEGMKALRVLHLENVIFSLEVLKLVTNLRTLCLVNCELENISSLGNMKNLEVLAFSDTDIYELPEELAALRGLKSLHFFDSGGEQINFPPNLLSRLTSLQELYVICENNVDLLELNSLSRLTVLSLRVSTAQCFPENFVFPKLQSYIIVVNKYVKFMPGPNFRTLEIVDSTSLSAYNELFCNVETLALENVKGHKDIVPNVDPEGLNASLQSLKKATIRECSELKSIFPPCLAQSLLHLQELEISKCDRLEQVFDFPQEVGELEVRPLSNLTSLELESLPELKWIWKGPTHLVNLQSLKTMRIWKCAKLAYLFLTPFAQSFLHLQELEIFECDRLEQVFDFPQEVGELEVRPLSNLTSLELNSLPELKWIWKGPTHLVDLQCLKTMIIWGCKQLAYLFSTPLAQSLEHLEVLEISYCDSLEHLIFDEAENEDQIVSNMDGYPLCWPKLRTLRISKCGRLKYVFPTTLAQGLPYLESVAIIDCSQLKQVFNVTKGKGGRPPQHIALQRLQILRLKNLEKLSSFCPENFVMSLSLKEFEVCNCLQLTEFKTLQVHLKELQLSELGQDNVCDTINWEKIFPIQGGHVLSKIEILNLQGIHQLQGPIQVASLPFLKDLKVSKCNRLKSLFSSMLARNLPQLKVLGIECCEELEEIIEMDQTSIASSSQGHLQPISFPSLQDIRISGCNNLKSLFTISVTRSFANLKRIEIKGASKLQQVFGYQGELNIEDDQKGIVLHKLQILGLSKLSDLRSFAPIGYHFRFPSLRFFIITKSPKLTKSVIMDSKHPVDAITEEPQQVRNNTTEGFTTMEEIVDNQSTCNDIFWTHSKDQIPLYMTLGETRIMLREEVKNQEKLVS